MKIAIIEDEQIAALECSEILEEAGHEIIGLFSSYEEAQEDIDRADLVIMDIRLEGGLDGIEATEKLKQNHPNTAVVYVTAHSDSTTLERAQQTHPAGYIIKPYQEQQLIQAVETAFRQS